MTAHLEDVAAELSHGPAPSVTKRSRSRPRIAEVLRVINDLPGDIPIEQATKFTTVVNLKTAKALGDRNPTLAARRRRRGDRMRRRDFLALVGGAAIAASGACRAGAGARENSAHWLFLERFS